ncbi:MAG: hypothetical protein A4E57_02012 [Syntrophorhabdaceae bacterium PtaU1.Bin034]|nr:MAG: hypothetical protein A4E57_02012 [Syntrophorhabdaceae bacterium PtaU1.Bin034]
MSERNEQTEGSGYTCTKCGVEMEPAKVQVTYLGNSFMIDVLRCPRCRLVLVTEDIAVGKMAEAEKVLEDK